LCVGRSYSIPSPGEEEEEEDKFHVDCCCWLLALLFSFKVLPTRNGTVAKSKDKTNNSA
jgi:hypothetical protein